MTHPIVLFGLSANPPTGFGGHGGIVRWAASGRGFSAFGGRPPAEVWVLPVFVHAFSEKRDMPAFEHRMEMARLAFEDLPGTTVPVRVLDVERRVSEAWSRQPGFGAGRPGTIDVVRYLYAAHPHARFGLLLGADTYLDLKAGKWKESRRLEELVDVIVVPRRGAPPVHPMDSTGSAGAGDPPDLDEISSSALRATTEESSWQKAVFPDVFAYVLRHRLYGFG